MISHSIEISAMLSGLCLEEKKMDNGPISLNHDDRSSQSKKHNLNETCRALLHTIIQRIPSREMTMRGSDLSTREGERLQRLLVLTMVCQASADMGNSLN